jgi:hypothetical protein
MAKFLNTSGVTFYLEELIKATKDRLILISPYLQLNDRIKEHLQNLAIQKKDIRIIFRENKLGLEESNWLGGQIGIRTSLCRNLHAKCYLNEKEAIITSMNLYEFSQQNNNEMGVYITRDGDPELFEATFAEANRLLTISDEIRVTVQKVKSPDAAERRTFEPKVKSGKRTGFCIRTGVEIPFNVERPFNAKAFESWSRYGDEEYPEKYCHFSGEPSHGENCFLRPILKKNWNKAKEYID